jgi:allantoinase
LHPFILGQPHRARYLDKILRHIVAHDGVWMATAGQISDWYTQKYLLTFEAHLSDISLDLP